MQRNVEPNPSASDFFGRLQIRLYAAAAFSMLQFFLLWCGIPMTSWVITGAALSWLLHRATAVLLKPTDELIDTLGQEVPNRPATSLSDIRSDGFVVHWKPAEPRASVDRYLVLVNGTNIGIIAPQEHAAVVSGLEPYKFYAVRLVAVSPSGHQVESDLIRLRTLALFPDTALISGTDRDLNAGMPAGAPMTLTPVVLPFRLQDAVNQSVTAPSMAREHSNSYPHSRRNTTGRRNTGGPADANINGLPQGTGRHQPAETVQQLTDRLESIRRGITEVERQEVEDERDFQEYHNALVTKRDALRQQLKDREDESKELKRAVIQLERQNTAVQNKKTAQERLVDAKLNGRRKMHEDMARWDKEVATMQNDIRLKEAQTREYCENAATKIEEIREQQNELMQTTKSIEEDIRVTGIQIKNLEDERPEAEVDIQGRNSREAEEDRTWSDTMNKLFVMQSQLNHELQNVEYVYSALLHNLEILRSQTGLLPPYATEAQVNGHQSPQNAHAIVNRGYSTSPSNLTPHHNVDTREPAKSFNRDNLASSLSGPSAAYSLRDSISINRAGDHMQGGNTVAEADRPLHEAAMSPTAGALLPSGLFMDDSEDPSAYGSDEEPRKRSNVTELRSSSQRNSMIQPSHVTMPPNDVLPGLGLLPGLGSGDGRPSHPQPPASPNSVTSRSPSLVSSPRDSTTNFQFFPQRHQSIGLLDSDRRSIKSTSSATQNHRGSSRFADFLNFRQRGKTLSAEGPALGSLKSSQSQSMPRQSELSPIDGELSGSPRKRLGNTGGLFNHISMALTRKPTNSGKEHSEEVDPQSDSTSMGLFGGFAGRDNIWSSSGLNDNRPRSPASMYSADNILRSNSENPSRTWLVDGPRHRNSPLTLLSSNSPWSARPSRRQSVQQDPSDDILDGTPDFDTDSAGIAEGATSPPQAPIGTRPRDLKLSLANKQLNPNARAFELKNMFKKRDKGSPALDDGFYSADDSSLAESRKSKDDRPRSATDSYDDSGDLASDGGPTTPSENTPQTANRESFIRKMTRKGSSSKVTIPFFKDKTSKKSAEPDGPDETDEDGTSGAVLVRSVDSATNSPLVTPSSNRNSVLSWASFRKKPRNRDAPSIDEASQASETGDEEDEE